MFRWENAAWACVLGLAHVSPARAFSDPFAYTDDPELGGGGGRWYTGSRADGYACDSCHHGGEPVDLKIIGLPLDGYVPGNPYEVIVQWPPAVEHVALVAEFTNDQNLTAGSIQLPRPDATQPAELCGPDLGNYPASEVFDTEEGRQMLTVIDCGAIASRFLWTAPMSTDEDIWFNLGFVSADGDGDATGDGVTLVAQPIPTQREGDRGSNGIVEPACSIMWSRQGRRPSGAWVLLGLALARLLGRGSQRRSLSAW